MDQIKVDAELQSLLDSLSDSEYEQLEENVCREGVRDPLVVWREEGVLLDGHHRYRICQEHDLSFPVGEISLPDKRAAKRWMIKNQLGKRNLTREQQSYYRGKLYSELKRSPGAPENNQNAAKQPRHSDGVESGETAETVAEQTGVNRRTVERDAKFADAVDTLTDDGIDRDTLTGSQSRISKKDTKKLAKHSTEERRDAVGRITSGEAKNLRDVRKQWRKEKQEQREEEAAKTTDLSDAQCTITEDQSVVMCDAVITDPPYGILEEDWEPDDLRQFTTEWLSRWNESGADFIASFWSQDWLYDGREWFDKALADYTYQQTLVWHYANNKSPQSRMGFKQTWEPILFYRRTDSAKEVTLKAGQWGDGINDFDCHVAAVPQSNFNDVNRKQHPAQKPLSVMEWLVVALTDIGDFVADPFCGSGTTGVAAVKHDRAFQGIEVDEEYAALARRRVSTYAS